MKTLILILTILVTLNVNAQGGYKMYSKVWDYDQMKSKNFTQKYPIDYGFYLNKKDSILKLVDVNKVKSLLLQSFNEFRRDYNTPQVTQHNGLTTDCENYSKKLQTNYVHDSKRGNVTECIGILPLYYTITSKNCGNINKIISECIFDYFVKSEPHMKLLLDDGMVKFGFGISLINDNIYIVIRSGGEYYN
jgi:hypothetical protein